MPKTPRPIRKAVFPVAGLGTRFLPATKAMPKEMLTVVDRPVIQHVVDEARAAGIEHFIFVTGRNKGVIEDHFDRQIELEATLEKRGKTRELDLLMNLMPGAGSSSFTRQQEPLGLGHAVWCARDLVGDEPFALLLPDVLVQAQDKSCLAQMMEVYKERGGNVIAVEEKPAHELDQYGVVSIGEAVVKDRVWPLTGMVEKPAKGTAPSSLTIMGRYILQPEIMTLLSARQKGAGGEIQVTDAMQRLLEQQPFWALRYAGRSFDCGSKVGFLTANLAFALEREDLAAPLRAEIAKLV
ncbi:MAG: UTP--glucose-1-phosphate uridylyltransferase [Hyphomicrobiaceae bacterium]